MAHIPSDGDRIHHLDEPDDAVGRMLRVVAVGIGSCRARQAVDGRRHGKLPAEPGGFAVVQFTLGGAGFWQDAAGHRSMVPVGEGLCLLFPGAFLYGPDEQAAPGSWQRVWMTIAGPTGMEAARALHSQTGSILRGRLQSATAALLALEKAAGAGRPHAELSGRAYAILSELSAGLARGDRLHPPPVRAALAEIRRRITDSTLDVAALARAADLSPAHFSRLFATHVGSAPMQHVLERRLRRAAARLRHSSDPERDTIAHIASACGFPSRQRLHQAFHRHYGCSPGAWRRGGH